LDDYSWHADAHSDPFEVEHERDDHRVHDAHGGTPEIDDTPTPGSTNSPKIATLGYGGVNDHAHPERSCCV
jgi:hypothetical protein